LAKLDEACRQLDEPTPAPVVVVTVKSLDGADVHDYSVNLFRKWGIGNKEVNRGVLILLAIQDHRYRITIGSGLDSILSEGNVSGFGIEAVPLLRRNDYSSAVLLMLSRVGHVIAENAGVNVPALDSAIPPQTQPSTPRTQPLSNAQPLHPTDQVSGLLYIIAILAAGTLVCIAYVLIQRGRRRQSYSITDASAAANTNTSAAASTTNLFLNPTSTPSFWNPPDTVGAGNDCSVSFGSGDTGSSFGGGDTGGGGAGGSW